jgi:hypothetical protein
MGLGKFEGRNGDSVPTGVNLQVVSPIRLNVRLGNGTGAAPARVGNEHDSPTRHRNALKSHVTSDRAMDGTGVAACDGQAEK